jgi:UDP-GlcNAc:undecaprenyl-phosphate GlcNAc-1-phosphate transferase
MKRLVLGFFLGILAVISGGKIATALLVMALPILDVVRVIIVRILRKRSITQGDREHLHFRLLELGLGERGVVMVFYLVAFFFGTTTFFLPSSGKIVALAAAFFGMVFFSIFLYRRSSSVT